MSKLYKIISTVMLSVFALLFIMDIAGVRICHSDSTYNIDVIQNYPDAAPDFHPQSKVPCQNDETPIEHVIHFSASNVFVKNDLFTNTIITDILPVIVSIFLIPSRMFYSVLENSGNYSFLISRNHPDRAPPVFL